MFLRHETLSSVEESLSHPCLAWIKWMFPESERGQVERFVQYRIGHYCRDSERVRWGRGAATVSGQASVRGGVATVPLYHVACHR
jgi:hypothetical protein